jgi:hypothetical protein
VRPNGWIERAPNATPLAGERVMFAHLAECVERD